MTPFRARMIRERQLHRKFPRTIDCYVTAVPQMAFQRPTCCGFLPWDTS